MQLNHKLIAPLTKLDEWGIAIRVLERDFICCDSAYEAGCISCEARRMRDVLVTMVKEDEHG